MILQRSIGKNLEHVDNAVDLWQLAGGESAMANAFAEVKKSENIGLVLLCLRGTCLFSRLFGFTVAMRQSVQ